jgi:hypothetical protein
MESIVISQAKLSSEIFFAFSANRRIDGRLIDPGVAGDVFMWYYHPKDKEPLTPQLATAQQFRFEVSRDDMAFRASARDMINHLWKKWEEFENEFKAKIYKQLGDDPETN